MDNKLDRRIGETDLEYHKRLVFGKLVDKNLSDEDYTELSKYIYGKEYSSDVCRRMCYGSRYTLDLIQSHLESTIDDSGILNELEIKKIELEKERKKMQTVKLEYNKFLRQDARLELFFEEFNNSAKSIEVPDFKPVKIDVNKSKREGLLGISDFHFGKMFVSINNKYSEEEFYERMNNLIKETVELCQEQNIRHLTVLNSGDDVEGMTLRISQLRSLQSGLTDQTIKVARYMSKFLKELSKYIPITYRHVMSGNHSEIRAFGDKTFTYENMERIIMSYIHDMLEDNERVEVVESNGKYLDFDIMGYNIYAEHGHKIKNPYNVLAKVSRQHRTWYDVAYFGHLHHSKNFTVDEASTHDCEVRYIPSIMGSDEYCDDLKLGGAKASALLDIYEEGKCIRGSFKIVLN